ncbi:hypothetical protein BC828DRAFT_386529 [Blastocladiella britannica]|nr:hypothetical protein BC828DRAFT_387225 [Blastocladiella britannica]KAI9219273.1 hypothetical protein BC828DRAFT_386529 [Blastocladiella britannica]
MARTAGTTSRAPGRPRGVSPTRSSPAARATTVIPLRACPLRLGQRPIRTNRTTNPILLCPTDGP